MLDPIIGFLKDKDELQAGRNLLDVFAKYATAIHEYDTLARLYHDVKDYTQAIHYALKTLTLAASNEQMYSARANLAKLYNHINEPEKALFYLNQNNAITPNDPEILLEKVFSLFLLNRKNDAELILRELAERTDLDDGVMNRVKFNLGTYDLYAGKFQDGLRGFILTGKEIDITKKKQLPLTEWEGGIYPDKKILIVAEAGIGDEIINFRFCKMIRDYGMEPIWVTANRPDLAAIFKRMGYRTYHRLQDVMVDEPNPEELMYCSSMPLPIYLDVQVNELWTGPYLTAEKSKLEKWNDIFNQKIRSDKPLKVGIRWNGNPFYDHDLHRGLPLQALLKAVNREKIQLISFQRDNNADEYLDYPEYSVVDIEKELETWDDTLAALSHLDLLVTSCTSIAHAGGALGIPTIVMVPISAYYTWASTHDQSSMWYGDNLKVVRQTHNKNWDAPMRELTSLIDDFVK